MWSYRIYGGGGAVVIPPEAGNLTGIIVSKLPKKLYYREGESIDITGLEVTATYDNDVSAIVTGACEVVVEDPLTSYTTSVTVRYEEMETTFSIKVFSEPEEIPASAQYLFHLDGDFVNKISGEVESSTTFDSTDLIVGKFGKGYNGTINISNITTKLPSFNDVYNGAEMTVECWVKGTHTATGNKNFIVFNAGARYIQMGWAQSSFRLGVINDSAAYTLANSTGNWVHVALTMKDSIAYGFVNGKKIGQFQIVTGATGDSLKIGADGCAVDEILICNKCLYTEDFIPPTSRYGSELFLEEIIVDTEPTKTTYQAGEKFSLDGAVINAVYSTGDIVDITNECSIVETGALAVGDEFRTITYTYGEVTKKLYINVGVYTTD